MDLRSFSNLWYWIALAVMWSMLSHRLLGVPYDVLSRARKEGGDLAEDVVDLARIYIMRQLYVGRSSGALIVAVVAFVMTTLIALGWGYGVEFAQALFFLAAPFVAVRAYAYRTALRIEAANPEFDQLVSMLRRYRLMVQLFGVVCIFITSLWGMYVNISGPSWY